jgi:hypothetical protein
VDTYFNCDGNSFYSGYIATGTGFQKSIGPCGSVRLSRTGSLTVSHCHCLSVASCSESQPCTALVVGVLEPFFHWHAPSPVLHWLPVAGMLQRC